MRAIVIMVEMETLILQRRHVENLLGIEECMTAVEHAFGLYAEGKAFPPRVLGLHADNGGFHIKAGMLGLSRDYFVAKINANFPGNPQQFGLPTIQGVIVVCDAVNGRLLAVMDSIGITIIRTGAATGIAAKYLARRNTSVVTICGCGNQGRISVKALLTSRHPGKLYAYDSDIASTNKFQKEFEGALQVIPIGKEELPASLQQSQVVIACTPSRQFYIHEKDIRPGTFIAAVGADSEDKQELSPRLVASSKIVTDVTEQCALIGELHHAVDRGLINITDVHAELGHVITGKKAGRESDNEIIIFDSTGTALQDVAAAAIVYEKAAKQNIGQRLDFSQQQSTYEEIKKKHSRVRALMLWAHFK